MAHFGANGLQCPALQRISARFSQERPKWPGDDFIPLYMFVLKPGSRLQFVQVALYLSETVNSAIAFASVSDVKISDRWVDSGLTVSVFQD
jgi:hypothetical protein